MNGIAPVPVVAAIVVNWNGSRWYELLLAAATMPAVSGAWAPGYTAPGFTARR